MVFLVMIVNRLKLIVIFGDIIFYQIVLKIMILNFYGKNLYKKIINNEFILKKVTEFEDRVKVLIPKFNDYFRHDSYFLSIKSKINDESDSRYPVIKQKNNIVSCFTGKIQGIYIIEDYILNIINNDK